MKNYLFVILAFLSLTTSAQQTTINFTESKADIVNPERGFYIAIETKSSSFRPLDARTLSTFRTQPQRSKSANYSVKVSLLYGSYELDSFKDKALSEDFLKNLQSDFDACRNTGLKMILRFAYVNKSHGGDCHEKENICPPYGDASYEIVMKHIGQLKPLFQKNADVIAVLQEGFIGIWGENYFSDYFGYAGSGISETQWSQRNDVLRALLEALPNGRMVQVRTPSIKQKFVGGLSATINVANLTEEEAFGGSLNSRIGFHNDCFLASPDDYGTFYDYLPNASASNNANEILRKYFKVDSKYTPVGGETCDDTFSPQNDCAPYGHALQEMAEMHYSYLNSGYNNKVNNDWDSLACMATIKNNLGYRLFLKTATLPTEVKPGDSLKLSLELENAGFASPFNPRPAQLVLRNTKNGALHVVILENTIQRWFPGSIHLKRSIWIPKNFEKGNYEVLVRFPDGYKSLENNPLYCIQLANENTWEEKTGMNNLHHTVMVK